MIIPLLVLYSISIVYIFMYVGKKALLSHRRWTLLKNVDWTCEHSDFVTRYLHISPIPFILATIIALSFILYGFINNTEWILHSYMFGVYAGMGVIALFYIPLEIHTHKKIPSQATRTARLSPRRLSDYIPSGLGILGHKLVAIIYIADFIFFAYDVISLHRLIANLSIHTFAFAISYAAIYYSLKERSIHMRDLSRVTDYDIHEEAREWGIRVLVGGLFFFIIMSVAGLISQLFGYELMNPTVHLIITKLGSQDNFKSIFSRQGLAVWSAVSVTLIFPLFYYIFRSKPMRILHAISFEKQGKS